MYIGMYVYLSVYYENFLQRNVDVTVESVTSALTYCTHLTQSLFYLLLADMQPSLELELWT